MSEFDIQDTFIIKRETRKGIYQDEEQRGYFEIIFISEGKGKHYINEYIVSYEEGDIFLIAPGDKHHFQALERTEFSHFRFTKRLFTGKLDIPDRSYWFQRIEHIINNPNLLPGDIIKEKADRYLIWHMYDVIIREYTAEKEFFQHNISNMVSTILSIIARNVTIDFGGSVSKKIKKKAFTVQEIKRYINANVYDTRLMKVSAIANKFGMTSSGLSAFFKRKSGESIHHYILMYRIELVKQRLKSTDFSVADIAAQLGFTDESHLTRIFKKYNDCTPKQYKVQVTPIGKSP